MLYSLPEERMRIKSADSGRYLVRCDGSSALSITPGRTEHQFDSPIKGGTESSISMHLLLRLLAVIYWRSVRLCAEGAIR